MDKDRAVKLIQKWATSHINHDCSSAEARRASDELRQVVELVDPGNKTQKAKDTPKG